MCVQEKLRLNSWIEWSGRPEVEKASVRHPSFLLLQPCLSSPISGTLSLIFPLTFSGFDLALDYFTNMS